MRAEAAGLQGSAGPDRSPSEAQAAGGTSRALVPIQPETFSRQERHVGYARATFLAHLIAAERRVPQMRTRSRAAPADAAAVYAATLAGTPAGLGRALRRSA